MLVFFSSRCVVKLSTSAKSVKVYLCSFLQLTSGRPAASLLPTET
jgi:hypothetical protein